MQTALNDIRVIDASRVLAGPFCTQILGDLGADVIKVERPGQGDETRAWGPPFFGDFSAYYLSCNRNKRSLALDMAKPEGRDLFYELIAKADVVLENFRPSSASKLGVTPPALHRVNPNLVICSISGFGRTGPFADSPGYDVAIQAMSGLMSITGAPDGPPYKVGVAVTDVLTGLYAAVAVLACLHARHKSGHGYAVDLALLDCALASQVNVAQAYLTSGVVPPRQGNEHLQIVPYQAFETADRWIIVAVGNDAAFQRYCRAIERHDLSDDDRFRTNAMRVESRRELIPVLEQIMKQRTADEWEQRFRNAGVAFAPVLDYSQIFNHEQIAARGMRVTVHDARGKPVDLMGTPFHIDNIALPGVHMPPRLGQHTDAVLREILEMDDKRVAELRDSGIVE